MGFVVDLRSDTVTRPTDEMRRAMAAAEVGDDVFGDDPTVRELEERAAAALGKEAGLFVASGTMGNLAAALTHTRPGQEIYLEAESHLYLYEVGGFAALGGLTARPLPGNRGRIAAKDLQATLRPGNEHFPPPGLVTMENTHNRAGGASLPVEAGWELKEVADTRSLPLHLDGARIFNAQVAQGVPAAELARPFDSVMFCLSKGLGAPVGSMLVGTKDWISRARHWRKMLGGGLRQVGVLAAAGLVALEEGPKLLQEDHAKARWLAERLANVPGLEVDVGAVETNMIQLDPGPAGFSAAEFSQRLQERGVLANPMDSRRLRLVTHRDISTAQLEQALPEFQAVAGGS